MKLQVHKQQKSNYPIGKQSIATLFLIAVLNFTATDHMNAQKTENMKRDIHENQTATVKITKFQVKPGHEAQFRIAMGNYVAHALTIEGNIMVEAYHEQEQSNQLWLIERWNKGQLKAFAKSPQAKALEALTKTSLAQSAKTFYANDLEPLTKQQWRTTAKNEDSQLIIMLFVDAKKGTQQNFKDAYHIAMPQFRSEPGVVTYQLSEIEGDGTQFVTYEKFRSPDAFQYHLNFPAVKPIIDYLETSIKEQPFQKGLHTLIEFAPMTRE